MMKLLNKIVGLASMTFAAAALAAPSVKIVVASIDLEF